MYTKTWESLHQEFNSWLPRVPVARRATACGSFRYDVIAVTWLMPRGTSLTITSSRWVRVFLLYWFLAGRNAHQVRNKVSQSQRWKVPWQRMGDWVHGHIKHVYFLRSRVSRDTPLDSDQSSQWCHSTLGLSHVYTHWSLRWTWWYALTNLAENFHVLACVM